MMSNEKLLAQLQSSLNQVQDELKKSGMISCKNEFSQVQDVLKQTANVVNDKKKFFMEQTKQFLFMNTVRILNDIIEKITAEGSSLETELDGVRHFSKDEYQKVQDFGYKCLLKEALQKMLRQIYIERPEILQHQEMKKLNMTMK